ncbi:MAG TPA: hypothetical protein VK167_12410 [Flavipsychrobacter sp.]|nr:hypothetical protein [Flavipsychrobacter sp.]
MAKHNVTFNLPNLELGNSDVSISIAQNGEKLGEIKISKGGLDYYPYKKKKPVTVSWARFNELMKQEGGIK